MMTSIAFPLMLVTYCSSSMPATVWLHGHFDRSLIWPWVKFQSNFLIQLPKAYLIIWAVWWKRMGCMSGVTRCAKAGFPPDLFPYLKAFASAVRIKWWYSILQAVSVSNTDSAEIPCVTPKICMSWDGNTTWRKHQRILSISQSISYDSPWNRRKITFDYLSTSVNSNKKTEYQIHFILYTQWNMPANNKKQIMTLE